MDRALVIVALAAGAAFVMHSGAARAQGVPLASAQNVAVGAGPATGTAGGFGMSGLGQTQSQGSGWQPPPKAWPYLATINAASARYGLPKLLLARVLQQESDYNPKAVSPAGAEGIAQLMPSSFPNVNPFDPVASIDAAAHYLARLYARFGSWRRALAAYNWGPGNLSAYGMAAAPAETRNYVSQIGADVPAVG